MLYILAAAPVKDGCWKAKQKFSMPKKFKELFIYNKVSQLDLLIYVFGQIVRKYVSF